MVLAEHALRETTENHQMSFDLRSGRPNRDNKKAIGLLRISAEGVRKGTTGARNDFFSFSMRKPEWRPQETYTISFRFRRGTVKGTAGKPYIYIYMISLDVGKQFVAVARS